MKRMGVILLICILLLTGCIQDNSANSNIRIALVAKSSESYFWKVVYAGVRSAAAEYGIEVEMFAPDTEDDYQTQVRYIEQVVEEGYDAFLFSACDYYQTADAVEAALDAGVEVITIDSGVDTERDVVFIGTDSVAAGWTAGELIHQFAGENPRVGVVSFEVYSYNGMQRNEGFFSYVEAHPDMQVLDLRYVDSNREEPYQATLDMLAMYPEINAIATFNEWTTLGVADAIYQQGLTDEITVIAFDNNEESVQMLERGVIDALIVQNPFAMGYLGVEQALGQLSGNKPEELTVYTETVAITVENMYTTQNQKLLFPFSQ